MDEEQSVSIPNADGIVAAKCATSLCQCGLKTGPWAGVVLSLLGGAVFWNFLHFAHPVFQVPEKYFVRNLGEPQERMDALMAVRTQVDRRNAMVDLSVFGVLLSVALALGEAIGRRSVIPVLFAAPVGAGLGCLAGLAGWHAHTLAASTAAMPAMVDILKAQAVLLGLLGLGVGLALGVSTKSLRAAGATLVAGFFAGVFAAVLFLLITALLMPMTSTEQLIPKDGTSRAVWIALTAGLLGLIITGTARLGKHQATAPPKPGSPS